MSDTRSTGPELRTTPQRTCVGCHRKADQSTLVRLVRSPEGEVVVDHPRRLGGRGAYVCASATCVARVSRSKRLGQLVGGPVARLDSVALGNQIEARISRRVLGLLSAAGRARKVALGATYAESALHKGSRLVVVAEDASARVLRNLEAAARGRDATLMVFGDKALLGRTFARELVGAVALNDDGLAQALRKELELLHEYQKTTGRTQTPSQRERMALERAT